MRTAAAFPLLVSVVTAGCYSIGNPDQTPTGPGDPGPAPSASVSGRVLSKELGLMAGVQIEVAPAGRTATTAADGQWRIDGLVQGQVTFTVSHLPAGCTDPDPQQVTLRGDTPLRIRTLVDCSGAGK